MGVRSGMARAHGVPRRRGVVVLRLHGEADRAAPSTALTHSRLPADRRPARTEPCAASRRAGGAAAHGGPGVAAALFRRSSGSLSPLGARHRVASRLQPPTGPRAPGALPSRRAATSARHGHGVGTSDDAEVA
eukprot:364809-Chlamydomonas_euryale.AAC.16